jgi:hypothetical protein
MTGAAPNHQRVIDQLLLAARATSEEQLRAATESVREVDGPQLVLWPEESAVIELVRRYCGVWLWYREVAPHELDRDEWSRIAVQMAESLYSGGIDAELRQQVERMVARGEASRRPFWRRWLRWKRDDTSVVSRAV